MEGGRACRAENNALPLDFGGNYFAIMVMHMFYSKLLYLKVFPILLIKNIAKKDTNDDDLSSQICLASLFAVRGYMYCLYCQIPFNIRYYIMVSQE
jgi:hypothetical protein